MDRVVIEFRSGTYFRSLKKSRGVNRASARRFRNEAAADAFMHEHEHEWILFAGGCAVPAKPGGAV